MVILALDCATQACSAALLREGTLVAHAYEPMARGHAERLLPMAQQVLNQGSTGFAHMDAFAVTIGPGTYTGVRIGLATARALSLAAARPLIGVTTMAAVALAASKSANPATGDDVLVIALETKRADFYIQSFRADLTPLSEPASIPPDQVAAGLPPGRLVIAGDAGPRLVDHLGPGHEFSVLPGSDFPDARHVAALAAQDPTPPSAPPTALYLRPPDVTLPKPRRP